MEHSWIPSGLYDEHCVHKFPCVGSRWAGVHLNTTGQSRSTSPLVAHLWTAGCWLADGDVTDDRDPWCWICVSATQNLSGWLWHSLIAECINVIAMLCLLVLTYLRPNYCFSSGYFLIRFILRRFSVGFFSGSQKNPLKIHYKHFKLSYLVNGASETKNVRNFGPLDLLENNGGPSS